LLHGDKEEKQMHDGMCVERVLAVIPGWLPEEARRYVLHTEAGVPLRALARGEGCHASTVLRQVRRVETRREDPLYDEALRRLISGLPHLSSDLRPDPEDDHRMTAHPRGLASRAPAARPGPDNATIDREARRILRRLSESGAFLVQSPDLDRAVVLRELGDGRTARIAVVERNVAEAFALKDWIAPRSRSANFATYDITAPGRAALKRLLADEGAARDGLAEAPARFAEQHRDWAERDVAEEGATSRRLRYNSAESPLGALGRRREKDGKPFLLPEMVAAGERLREDFELAQMGPRVAQNWDRFLTAGSDRGQFSTAGGGGGPEAARARVAAALAELGPGLGDMVLRVCCFLEGLEAAEKRMGWAARSGKVVLRIALIRLCRHYEERGGRYGKMIG
jgi:hypothetical protein